YDETDQRAPERQTRDEGARAVDRVDHPHMAVIWLFGAKLLPQDAVLGKFGPCNAADRQFSFTVGLGNRVKTVCKLGGDITLAAKSREGLRSRSRRKPAHKLGTGI